MQAGIVAGRSGKALIHPWKQGSALRWWELLLSDQKK